MQLNQIVTVKLNGCFSSARITKIISDKKLRAQIVGYRPNAYQSAEQVTFTKKGDHWENNKK